MRALRTFFSTLAQPMTPDGTMARMRFHMTLHTLVTLAVTVLAVVLAIGYQVVGPLARRFGWVD